jgi:hypothetical protein
VRTDAPTPTVAALPDVQPPVAPSVEQAAARRGLSTTLVAVLAVVVAAVGAGVAIALVDGAKSGHTVRAALVGTATSAVITESEAAPSAAQGAGAGTTASTVPGTSTNAAAGDIGHIFHAPGNNATCEVQADDARCSIASNDQTFVLPANGEPSYMESGLAVARGSGSLANYGTSVSVGVVTCVIPMELEPRGIVCANSTSGHGFEASRDASRQKIY